METSHGRIQFGHTGADSTAEDTGINYWRYHNGWIWEGDRKMIWLPEDIDSWEMAHHNGLFAFVKEDSHIVLGFTQNRNVLDEEMKEFLNISSELVRAQVLSYVNYMRQATQTDIF
ncbi:MAG: hypothetical protein Q9174_007096 [Haloplaca sp. 1 TL-2023]